MKFWQSDLVKNLEKGQLPQVETVVSIDTRSMVILGVVLASVAVVIALVVVVAKKTP